MLLPETKDSDGDGKIMEALMLASTEVECLLIIYLSILNAHI